MNTDCRFIDWLADCGQHHIGPVARHAELRIAIQVGKIWNFPGCEDLGETHPPSDLENEEPVVDTDQDQKSLDESGSSFTSDDTETSEDERELFDRWVNKRGVDFVSVQED